MDFTSTDMEIIKKKKLATHVQVHISNLVAPSKYRAVRQLDESHVKTLKAEFCDTFNQSSTILVGLVPCEIENNLNELAKEKGPKVEVLGGNHTRAALQSMSRYSESFVYMDIYVSLTNDQAVKLGLMHNRAHEFSLKTSFTDLVVLFREKKEETELQSDSNTPRRQARQWRSKLCSILGLTKRQLKNGYQTHLHLAGLSTDEWNALKEVALSFQLNKIKGQKKTDKMSQYVFGDFKKGTGRAEERLKILNDLSAGLISVKGFKARCKSLTSTKEVNAVEDTGVADISSHLTTDSVSQDDVFEYSDTELRNGTTEKSFLNENCTTEDNALKIRLKHEIELRKKAQSDLQELNSSSQERESQLTKTHAALLEKYQQEVKHLTEKVQKLTNDLSKERMMRQEAEETAGRARSKLLTSLEKNSDRSAAVKRKAEESPQKNSDRSAAVKRKAEEAPQKNSDRSAAVKRKAEEAPQKCSDKPAAVNRKMEDAHTNSLDKPSTVKQNTEKNEDGSSKKLVDIALVEYTNRRVFYVYLQDKTNAVYCKHPVGKFCSIGKTFIYKTSSKSFQLNKTDIQVVNTSYIIKQMKGSCENGVILVDKLSSTLDNQLCAINDYFKP